MRNIQIIGLTLGILLLTLGAAELLPALVDWGRSDNALVFLASALVSLFFGGALVICNRGCRRGMTVRGAFFLTNIVWIAFSVFAAIPLVFSDIQASFVDALFEVVSGLTTTGSTVFVGLDGMSHGILLWRSLMCWIGGIGIIGMAMVILPFLQVGGMQLFRTESSDKSDKIMPRTAQFATSLLVVYLLISAVFALVYRFLGMTWFDAANHAMTTIATAGYSTHDTSFAYFDSWAIEYASAVFMLLSALPFVYYIKALYLGKFDILRDDQVRFFLVMVAAFVGVLTLWTWIWGAVEYDLAQAFRYATFNMVSVITNCGYASTDYVLWGPFAWVLFLVATYPGGCAGSTAGGLKAMRVLICIRATVAQVRRLLHPSGVFPVRYQGQVVSEGAIGDIFGFLGVYVLANVVFTLVLAWTGLDLATAVSAVAQAFSNTGPGVGAIVGPAGNFTSLTDTAKLALAAAMLLGRLEIMTVLVLFSRDFWRA